MRLLIDTNVVLDLLLNRQPFARDAFTLWQTCDEGHFERFVSAITPINVFYIARKLNGQAVARQIVTDLLTSTRIAPVDGAALHAALALPVDDFEDATQIAAAMAISADAIITRNLKDFAHSPVAAMTPADCLRQFLRQ